MKIIAVLAIAVLGYVSADTPANCTYDDVAGIWQFYEGVRGNDNQIDCTDAHTNVLTHVTIIQLLYPNKAVDQNGNKGSWTMVYNQGFEVIINSRKYFAWSKFVNNGNGTVTDYCHKTLPGWSHDIFSRDWACYYGEKMSVAGQPEFTKLTTDFTAIYQKSDIHSKVYQTNPDFIKQINSAQKSWTAKVYDEYNGVPIPDLINKFGGIHSRIHTRPRRLTNKISTEVEARVKGLPSSFDWRNVGGVNYLSPVRNQGHCGSCFAFASMAMLESRTLIMTKSTERKVFSPQDIVACTDYSQGCAGGFPYLIAGKYAEDFGVVEESCNPYPNPIINNPTCLTSPSCRRYYATKYSYVSGFYGGCNEELMLLELVENGPVVVAFEVYDDFFHYSSGIYHHTGQTDSKNDVNKFNPFQIVNHAVTVVGYGADESSNQKYWIVKNSWGTNWGEDGYFRIRRGNDECAIESLAMVSTPIPTY